MNGLRVAIFGDLRPHRINGFATSLTALTHSLKGAGQQVELFSTSMARGQDSAEIAGIQVCRATSASSGGYDVVILTGCFDPRLWRVALRCKRAAIPYVVSPRGSLMRQSWRTSFFKKALVWPILRFWYFRGRVAVHFLSMEEQENSWSGLQQRPFFVPNVLSIPLGNNTAPKQRIIGFLGRMDVRHKGLDTLLDAVALIAGSLRTACYRVELVGPDHRGGVVRLHKTIARLGIGDIVAVLPAKRGAEKLDWLSSVTAFVHASRYEGQPQAVFEAIARGAIPIVTHSCNMDKLIEDIGVGFAVDGNASAIAGALAKVMTATAFPDPKHLQAFFADYAEATVAARMITQLRAFVSEMRAS